MILYGFMYVTLKIIKNHNNSTRKIYEVKLSLNENNFIQNINKISNDDILVCYDKTNVPGNSNYLTPEQVFERDKRNIEIQRRELNKNENIKRK